MQRAAAALRGEPAKIGRQIGVFVTLDDAGIEERFALDYHDIRGFALRLGIDLHALAQLLIGLPDDLHRSIRIAFLVLLACLVEVENYLGSESAGVLGGSGR